MDDDTTIAVQPIDLADTYVHLENGPGVNIVPVGPDFWSTIDDRDDLAVGRLVMAGDVTDDWDIWEMHPAGDELILVTAGRVRVHTEREGRVATTAVGAPHLVVMSAGTWHTLDVIEPARVVTVTSGAGTEHRPR